MSQEFFTAVRDVLGGQSGRSRPLRGQLGTKQIRPSPARIRQAVAGVVAAIFLTSTGANVELAGTVSGDAAGHATERPLKPDRTDVAASDSLGPGRRAYPRGPDPAETVRYVRLTAILPVDPSADARVEAVLRKLEGTPDSVLL